ncbi:unnamed protein product [Psylliodes chrysocephalus]|uniref:Uncharacterized protein n=1 Tax=Psylliodes chrysocephalus TaxID=3402493 RepID=A0A9P0C9B7_9CUCU|nr:unnamed protein product [Psylliodes chrysocephala]
MENSHLIIKRSRLRIKKEDDICLIREVAGHNPFLNSKLWTKVKENVNLLCEKNFLLKTLKDHVDLLIKLWLKKTKILKDKSEIEEAFSEKIQLCQNIQNYMIQFRLKGEMTAKKKPAIHPGKIERNKWTYALNVLNKNAITIPTMNSFFNEDDSNMPSTSEDVSPHNKLNWYRKLEDYVVKLDKYAEGKVKLLDILNTHGELINKKQLIDNLVNELKIPKVSNLTFVKTVNAQSFIDLTLNEPMYSNEKSNECTNGNQDSVLETTKSDINENARAEDKGQSSFLVNSQQIQELD